MFLLADSRNADFTHSLIYRYNELLLEKEDLLGKRKKRVFLDLQPRISLN